MSGHGDRSYNAMHASPLGELGASGDHGRTYRATHQLVVSEDAVYALDSALAVCAVKRLRLEWMKAHFDQRNQGDPQ